MKVRKKYDTLLKIFYENRDLDYVPVTHSFFIGFMDAGKISRSELRDLLDKLNRDQYLIRVIDEYGWPPNRLIGYKISSEGMEFFEDGGYTRRNQISIIEKIWSAIKFW